MKDEGASKILDQNFLEFVGQGSPSSFILHPSSFIRAALVTVLQTSRLSGELIAAK